MEGLDHALAATAVSHPYSGRPSEKAGRIDMDPNRLTEKAQETLRQAQSVAALYRHQQVDNEHLFLALLEQEIGIAPPMVSGRGRMLRRSAPGS